MVVINCLELAEKLEPIAFHHTHRREVFRFIPGNFPSDDMCATNVATVAAGLRRETNRSANSEQRLKRPLSWVFLRGEPLDLGFCVVDAVRVQEIRCGGYSLTPKL